MLGVMPEGIEMTFDEAQDLVTDEMLDAAQAAVPDAYRVDAMRIISAALQVLYCSEEGEAQFVVFSDPN